MVDLPSENIHSNASSVKGSAIAICRLFTYAETFINIRANKRAKADNVNEWSFEITKTPLTNANAWRYVFDVEDNLQNI